MTVEATIFNALKGLVNNRVYPDVAPANTARPYITYQQVGGAAINYVEQEAQNASNGRFQVNVWADSRVSAAAIGKQVEDLMRLTVALHTTVLGDRVATYDTATGYRGTRQDFSCWTIE